MRVSAWRKGQASSPFVRCIQTISKRDRDGSYCLRSGSAYSRLTVAIGTAYARAVVHQRTKSIAQRIGRDDLL